jgi:glycosyltransferase involved in cell wall biosynthesis
MRLLHVVPYYLPAVRYGGPIVSVHGLCKALASRGHDIHVFTTNVDGPGNSDVPLAQPVDVDGVKVWYFPSPRLRRLYWAPRMGKALTDQIASFDLVHLHSIYLWPTLASARIAERNGVPYVVSPRGMLEKKLIRTKSRLVKSAWIALFEKRTLERAAAIHMTSAREAAEVKAFAFRLPPRIVLPNGVDLDPQANGSNSPSPALLELIDLGPYLLFLGRINWKKGLDRLILSLRHVHAARLIVAGNDEENYQPFLEALVEAHGLSERVVFTGPVWGADKAALLAEATALVLPSYSENFGNVVLEAMAYGRPVIVTPEVGISDVVADTGAGLVVSGDPECLGPAIESLLTDRAAMDQMGERGRNAVLERFTWESVAQHMEDAYGPLTQRRKAS